MDEMIALDSIPVTAGVPMVARSDIAKCAGASLSCCALCVRNLAPVGAGQQWVEPEIDGRACALFASVDRFGALYAPAQ